MAQVSYNKFLIYLFTYSIIFIIVLFFLSSYFLQSKSVERDIKKDWVQTYKWVFFPMRFKNSLN